MATRSTPSPRPGCTSPISTTRLSGSAASTGCRTTSPCRAAASHNWRAWPASAGGRKSSRMTRRFFTLDVFAERALAGNPLAVVLDSEGLDDRRMQAIAREFNLSETVFVFEPRNPVNTARARIFTPARELPFAGHPTVGTAALIAHMRAPDLLATQDIRIVLEEGIGDVVCVVRQRKGRALAANFGVPKLPQRLEAPPP